MPGLRFPAGVGSFEGDRSIVVWVNLEGEPLGGVEQFDEEGEAVRSGPGIPEEFFAVSADHRVEDSAGGGSREDLRVASNQPDLADG